MKRVVQCILIMAMVSLTVVLGNCMVNNLPEVTIGTKETSEEIWKEYIGADMESLSWYELEDFDTELPVLFVNTKGRQLTKEIKSQAVMAILNNDEGRARSIMEDPDDTCNITINYRGASSYGFDKSQYRISFYNSNKKVKKNYNFLGIGSNSDWVLNGPILDKTLIRNKLVYGIAGEVIEWAPECKYVELFIDGEYQGVYLAIEPITNGESRLRLCEFSLLGGKTAYILKRERIGTEDILIHTFGEVNGYTNNNLSLVYPSKRKVTGLNKEWINQDFSAYERALFSDYFTDSKIGYAKYIDVENFVDCIIINELVLNHDWGNLSSYYYKELNGKIMMTVWDYNNSYDNYQWFPIDYTKIHSKNSPEMARLLSDRAFVDVLVFRYRQLRKGALSTEHMLSQIDIYEEELGDAVNRNMAVWGYSFRDSALSGDSMILDYLIKNGYVPSDSDGRNPRSYEEAIGILKGSLIYRADYLDQHIEDLYEDCIN